MNLYFLSSFLKEFQTKAFGGSGMLFALMGRDLLNGLHVSAIISRSDTALALQLGLVLEVSLHTHTHTHTQTHTHGSSQVQNH